MLEATVFSRPKTAAAFENWRSQIVTSIPAAKMGLRRRRQREQTQTLGKMHPVTTTFAFVFCYSCFPKNISISRFAASGPSEA
jgi:hypothetical protein